MANESVTVTQNVNSVSIQSQAQHGLAVGGDIDGNLTITPEWNVGSTTFTSLLVDVTDTASATASKLLDLKVGGSSKFSVLKSGQVAGLSIGGATQLDGTLTVGENDLGHDVKFFGATSGKYLQWDESADKLIISGDLDVTGTTTSFNSTVVTIDDPVFTIGGDTAPSSDDNKDRGIEFRYHDGSTPRVGFFGYDDSESAFTFLTSATNTSEVFSGTLGDLNVANVQLENAGKIKFWSNDNNYIKYNEWKTQASTQKIENIAGDIELKASDSSGTIQFETNGTEAARFDSDGNFIINDSNEIKNDTSHLRFSTGSQDNNNIVFKPNGTLQMTLTDTGLLGIGGTPTQKLSVFGGHIELDDNRHIQWGGSNNRITGNDASDFIRVFTAGNEVARFTSNGTFEIKDSIKFEANSYSQGTGTIGMATNDILYIRGGSSGTLIQDNDGSEGIRVGGGYVSVETGSVSNRMRINSTGVGISTSTPSHKLNVVVSESDDGIVLNKDGSSNDIFKVSMDGTNDRGELFLYNAGTRVFAVRANSNYSFINTGANFGIGTTSPARPLHVNAGTTNVVASFESTDAGAYLSFSDDSTTDDTYVRLGAVGDEFQFFAGGGERVRIDSAGFVGIGTNNPQRELEIQGAGNVFARITASTDNDSAALELNNNGNELWTLKADDTDSDAFKITNNNGTALTIDANKNVGIGYTSMIKELMVNGSILIANNRGFLQYDAQSNVATLLNLTTANTLDIGQSSHVDDIHFNIEGTDNAMILSSTGLGIGGTPISKTYIESNNNSFAGTGAPSNYHLVLRNPQNDLSEGVGIGFTSSTGTDSIGAAIAFERTDSQAQGDLVFSAKSSTVTGGSLTELFRLDGSASSINVPDEIEMFFGSSSDFSIKHGPNNTHQKNFAGDFYISNDAANKDLIFRVSDGTLNELMRLDGSTGNVGIGGVTSPIAKLDISSDDQILAKFYSTTNKAGILIQDNDTSAYVSVENNKLALGPQNGLHAAQNLNYDLTNYRLGIGTATPSQKITIVGTSDTGIIQHIEGASDYGATTRYSRAGLYTWQIGIGGSLATLNDIPVSAFGIVEGADTRLTVATGGNVGIGTITPNYLLDVEKAGAGFRVYNLTDNGQADIAIRAAGTTGSSRIFFGDTADSDIGAIIYRHNGDSLSFETNDSEAMRIDSSGKVGIGTTTPTDELTISGTSQTMARIVSTDNTGARLDLHSSGGGRYSIQALAGVGGDFYVFDEASGHNMLRYGDGASGYWRIFTNNSEAMRIDSSGNVGIGTTSPSSQYYSNLVIGNNDSGEKGITIRSNASNGGHLAFSDTDAANAGRYAGRISYFHDTNSMRFYTTAGDFAMAIDSSQRVGIGTTSPSAFLHVSKDNDNSGNQFCVADTEGVSAAVRTYTYNGDPQGLIINHYYAVAGSSNEYMRYADFVSNVGNGAGTSIRFITKNAANTYTATTIDNEGNLDIAGNIVVGGDLTINGTTTTIDTANLTVEDKNIIIGNVSSPSDTTADGGGFTLKGASDYTIQWTDATNRWQFNQGIQVDDNSRFVVGSSGDASFYHNGTDTYLENATGDLVIRNLHDDGDIWFQSDNGSGATTTYLQIDGGGVLTRAYKNFRAQDDVYLQAGSSGDLEIFHTANNSYINNKTGDLYIQNSTDDADVIFRSDNGSGGLAEYFRLDGGDTNLFYSQDLIIKDSKRIKFGDNHDLQMFHNGTNNVIESHSGDLSFINYADDKDIIFKCDDGSGGVDTYLTFDGSARLIKFEALAKFLDNRKAAFGDSSDLTLYHNGTNSNIENITGNINIINYADDKDIAFQCDDGSGGVETYFLCDGSASSGNPIIRFPDNSIITLGTDNDLYFRHDGTNSYLENNTGDFYIRANANDKDIIFQSDDGSGGLETYFRLDGSASSGDPVTEFPDNSKLSLGTSQHGITLYHDGTDSFITNAIGDLTITNFSDDKDIIFKSDDGSGGTEVYFFLDGSAGVDNPFTVFPDNARLTFGDGYDLRLFHNGTHSYIQNFEGDLQIIQYADDKDIEFQCDDGSGGTTTYFLLDGSVGGASPYTVFPDDSRLAFGNVGDGSYMHLVHDATNSYIENKHGHLFISNYADDKDIIFQSDDGSGGLETYFTIDGGSSVNKFHKALYNLDGVYHYFGTGYDLSIWHDATNSNIRNQTGDLYIANYADDKDIIFQSDDGSGGVATYFRLDGSMNTDTTPKTVFPDNSKLQFGSGLSDLRIYHDGTDSQIESKTGTLVISNNVDNADIRLQASTGSGSAVDYLILDSSQSSIRMKRQTKWDDNIKATFGDLADLDIHHNGTDSVIDNFTGDLYISNKADDKDIVFRCDDGSGGYETYFFLDGSASSGFPITVFPDNSYLQFGTSLDFAIVHNGTNALISNTTGNIKFTNYADDADIKFECDDGSGGVTEYFRIDGGTVHTIFSKNTLHEDGVVAKFGTGADLQLSHNGTSLIKNTNGDLIIENAADDKDIIFRSDDGSGSTETYFYLDGSASSGNPFTVFPDLSELAFGDSRDLRIKHTSSDSYISNYTGDLYIRNDATDKDIVFQSDDGSGGMAQYIRIDGSAALTQFDRDTKYADTRKAIFGNDSDLEIHHDGTHGYIENNTGVLYIKNNADDQRIRFIADDGAGGTTAYFDLTSSQATHNGTNTTMLMTSWGDNSRVVFGNSSDMQIWHDSTDSRIYSQTGDLRIQQAANDKDIIFECDDGSGGMEAYFYLDGSISTGNPFTIFPTNARCAWGNSAELQITHAGTDSYIANYTGDLYVTNDANEKDIIFKCDDGSGGTTDYLRLDGSAERMRVYKDFFMSTGTSLYISSVTDGLRVHHSGSLALFANGTGNFVFQNDEADTDIIFKNDNGSGGTTEYLSLDGGREVVQHHRGVEYNVQSPNNTDYTVGSSDYCIIMHSLTQSRTVTIPTAQRNAGRVLIIKERDGYASSYSVVIDPEGSTTIDGNANYTISTNKEAVTLISDGSNWFIIGKS